MFLHGSTKLEAGFPKFHQSQCSSFCLRFRICVFHKDCRNASPKSWKNADVWSSSIVQWFYLFPYASSMQKTSQMHLHKPPTWFEGTRGRTIVCRGPGQEIYETSLSFLKYCTGKLIKHTAANTIWANTRKNEYGPKAGKAWGGKC